MANTKVHKEKFAIQNTIAGSLLTHNRKDWIIQKNRITNSRNEISEKD
jgi:hypothetical protein